MTVQRPWRQALWLALMVALLVGCTPLPTPTMPPPPPALPPTPAPTSVSVVPTSAAVPTMTARPTPVAAAGVREIVILYTNDEHGRLLPLQSKDFIQGGAAYSAASWLKKGYDPTAPTSNVLLLSGGDNWTGPAISTWFEGASTVEAMNVMGYRASTLGNHDFDFGQDGLRRRLKEAKFPFLAANITRTGSKELPDFAQAYLIVEVNQVMVGIVGLANRDTPQLTSLKNLEGLTFGDYEAALRQWVPVVRQKGAQVVVVVSHVCPQDLSILADIVRDLNIAFLGGGHCHLSQTNTVGEALVGASSAYWNDYLIAKLTYDPQAKRVVKSELALEGVMVPRAATVTLPTTLTAVIDRWSKRADAALGEQIGYTQAGIEQSSPAFQQALVASWLWAFPQGDIAISNVGGFRQGIKSGPITLGDIVGVLPFDNEIYELEVTGKEALRAINADAEAIVVAGIQRDDKGNLTLTKNGAPLKPEGTYRLLVTDFMYTNTRYPLRGFANKPYETSVLWRQPLIDWIRVQHSTPDKPLEKLLGGSMQR